ncbi:hypothetical protein PV04_00709 [Phialophora macrospora]|uniref:Uncharacterized protein n=1 Tax=Phialophora macrospora TaxID=1851006 RepID=A0A0D2GJK1_9EURO|nr:hypothetical protein PV04_00709 [Phialophora macrospora]
MDLQQPWLAEFIESGLGAWFHKLEGTPNDQYSFRKVDDVLRVTQTTKNVRTVRLLKLPQLGIREPRGEVSDGAHTIEAVFPTNNATALLQAGAQRGTVLSLADPVIRVTAHVNPPKPLLEFDRWEFADDKDQVPEESSTEVPVMQEQAILDSMSRYGTVKSHNCGASNPVPHSSPRSIISQAPFSPRNHAGTDDEDEDNLSQHQFFTQPTVAINLAGPTRSSRSPHTVDSELASEVETLQSFQKREMKPSANASSADAGKRTAPTPLPSLSTSPRSINPSSSEIPDVVLNQEGHENSSPIETTELVANIDLSAQPLQTAKDDNLTNERAELSPVSPRTPCEDIDAPCGSLRRWRLHSQGRRYIPRYVCKIPRDQEDFLKSLLESGDSWQPPLVGHVHRPGQVPLTLLEQLCNAADKHAQHPVTPPSPAKAVNTLVQGLSSPRGRNEGTVDATSNDEGASQAAVEWSPSPPTQQRRHRLASVEPDDDGLSESAASTDLSPSPTLPKHQITALPQSSPPVDLRGNRQLVGLESGLGSPELNGRIPHRVSVNDDQEVEQDEFEFRSNNVSPRPPSRISELHVECTPSVTQTPLSVRSADVGSKDRRVHTTNNHFTSSQMMGNFRTKKIQVKRTPYPINDTALLPRPGGERINNEAPLSSVVPGTYTSLTSGEVPSSDGASGHLEAALTVTTAKARAPASVNSSAAADNPSHAKPSKASQEEVIVRSTEQPIPLPVLLSGGSSQRSPHNPVQALISNALKDMEGVQFHDLRIEQTKAGDRDQAESIARQTNDEDVSQQPIHPDGPVLKEVNLRPVATESSEYPASVKRKRDDSGGNVTQMKRQRRHPQTSSVDANLAICEKGRNELRENIQAISKPKSPFRRPSNSSLDADSSSRPDEAPLSIAEQPRMPDSTIDTRPSSTPVTRQSTYSGVWHIEDKTRPSDSASLHSLAAGAAASERELFSKYCAAYPDYEGDADDFLRSYHFIQGVLNDEPNKIHSSLLDDAVFHHYYSYPPYKETMGFVKFFNECVEDPRHHKRIIKLAAAERLPSHDQLRRSTFTANSLPRAQPSSDPRSALASSAVPMPSMKDGLETGRKQQQALVHTDSEPPATAALSQESIDCIEKWRENAAPRVSPELGTADIDRSLLTTSKVEKSVSLTATPSLPSKIRHLPQPLERSALAPTPTPEPTGSNLKSRSPASTAQARRDASAKSSVMPQPPSSAVKARSPAFSSQAVEGERPGKWFTETNTAFTHFEKEYIRLYKEKKGKSVAAKARYSAPSRSVTGTGIDIFSWRK